MKKILLILVINLMFSQTIKAYFEESNLSKIKDAYLSIYVDKRSPLDAEFLREEIAAHFKEYLPEFKIYNDINADTYWTIHVIFKSYGVANQPNFIVNSYKIELLSWYSDDIGDYKRTYWESSSFGDSYLDGLKIQATTMFKQFIKDFSVLWYQNKSKLSKQ